MNILMCAAFTDEDQSLGSFKAAFERLGHRVLTCGPQIGNFEYDPFLEHLSSISNLPKARNPLMSKCDIKVYDRKHPEKYSYEEIVRKINGKNISLIIQRDPHFFLYGKPPKGIPTAYYLVDIHRGGKHFIQLAKEGNFNFVFIAYKYFERHLKRYGMNPIWIPRAFDDSYIIEYPEIEEQCDIVFCGETGISSNILNYNYTDQQVGRRYFEGEFPKDLKPLAKYQDINGEYIERAELLMRLSRDFKLRIYEMNRNVNDHLAKASFAKAICRGKMGFNYNLRYDLTVRNFEIMACNRLLITNDFPDVHELFKDGTHLRTFRSYYRPQFSNFDLDYEEVRDLVRYYLDNEKERKRIAAQGKDLVFSKHTERHRAQQIINEIFGEENV